MKIDQSYTEHAKFSPSAAERWISCTASFQHNLEKKETSPYAEEGKKAHALAAVCLEKNILPEIDVNLGIDIEMVENVTKYIDFVKNFQIKPKIEQKVIFSQDCWGTADCLLLSQEKATIIDLKYGKGVPVFAENNYQLLTYAVAVQEQYDFIYNFKDFELIIVQPRLNNISRWTAIKKDVDEFQKRLKKAIGDIEKNNFSYTPGEKQCRWCAIRINCQAKYGHNVSMLNAFGWLPKAETLTAKDVAFFLPKIEEIENWIEDIKKFSLSQALKGETIPGYKVVEGRSNRKWKENAEKMLEIYGNLFERKLVTITQAEKIIGKNNDDLKNAIYKPQGAPTLAPENDSRPVFNSIVADFS